MGFSLPTLRAPKTTRDRQQRGKHIEPMRRGELAHVRHHRALAPIAVEPEMLAELLHHRKMCVSPGVVDTDFVPGRDAAALAKIAPTIPAKRIATADDVARAIAACATHLTYSTGSLVIVDGGRAL
jgi:hypothetical protein